MASFKAYDENLLSHAPEVTRADLQDGYNPDILREPTVKRTHSTRAPQTPPSRSNTQEYHLHDKDVTSSAAPLQLNEGVGLKQPRKPWWRTGKGITVIAVVTIAIILAAVLGGVLGSRKHNPAGGPEAGAIGPDQGQGSTQPPETGNGAAPVPTTSGFGATATITQPAATAGSTTGNAGGNVGGEQAGALPPEQSGGRGGSPTPGRPNTALPRND